MNAGGEIAVVVLTHNRRTEIQRTVEHLLRCGEAAQICVVDNGSTDGMDDLIARRFPSVQLLRLSENLGGAGRAIAGITLVAGLLAGACAMRRETFLAAGGYELRLFLGGEERLLGLDLMAAGWHLGYTPELIVHHHPSRLRDSETRRRLLLRNALWCAWLRRPLPGALRETFDRLRAAAGQRGRAAALLAALYGLPWVIRRRRVIPAHVEAKLGLVEGRDA